MNVSWPGVKTGAAMLYLLSWSDRELRARHLRVLAALSGAHLDHLDLLRGAHAGDRARRARRCGRALLVGAELPAGHGGADLGRRAERERRRRDDRLREALAARAFERGVASERGLAVVARVEPAEEEAVDRIVRVGEALAPGGLSDQRVDVALQRG